MSATMPSVERFAAQHSGEDVLRFALGLIGRVWDQQPGLKASASIRDSSGQGVLGYVVPLLDRPVSLETADFVAGLLERINHPPVRFLSYDEMVGDVRDESAKGRA